MIIGLLLLTSVDCMPYSHGRIAETQEIRNPVPTYCPVGFGQIEEGWSMHA